MQRNKWEVLEIDTGTRSRRKHFEQKGREGDTCEGLSEKANTVGAGAMAWTRA